MPPTSVDKLRDYIRNNKDTEFTVEQVVNVMRLVRMIIEADNSKSNYPTLYLFCHLVQHETLDRNLEGLRFLEGINDAMVASMSAIKDNESLNKYVEAVNHAFRFADMRKELISFSETKQVDLPFLHYRSSWAAFLIFFFRDIAGRMIKFPENIEAPGAGKKEKAVFKAMLDKASANGGFMMPWSFCVNFDENSTIPSIAKGLVWSVKMVLISPAGLQPWAFDGPNIVSGVGIMEDSTKFKNDR